MRITGVGEGHSRRTAGSPRAGVWRWLAVVLWAPALLPACGPWGPQGILPGGPFLGSARSEPITDWSFTEDHLLIGIETRGRFFPHAVTILCTSVAGELYVSARHAPRKRWVRNLEHDPRVRLRIDDALYEGRAVRVRDRATGDAIARAFLRKYVGLEAEQVRALTAPPASEDDRAEVWSWRIERDPTS